MTSTYHVHVRLQHLHYRNRPEPLSAETLPQIVHGVVVRGLTAHNDGSVLLELALNRPSHEDALNEIAVALQQLGYSWLDATITEWADNMFGGAIVGALGCGTVGANSDAATGALAALVGLLIGAVVGSLINTVKVVYTVHWTGGGWRLTPATPPPAALSSPRPAF